MIKQFLLFVTCLVAASAQAQKLSVWQDPNVNQVNREVRHAHFFGFENEDLAKVGDKTKSGRYLSMEGMWKFCFVKNHQDAPKDFFTLKYDDSKWTDFPVPGLFELNGYGDKIYKNIGYAWSTTFKSNPPYIGETNNYTGSYRRTFELPADWKGQEVFLDALTKMRHKRLGVVFIGSDQGRTDYTAELKAAAARLPPETKVVFLEHADDMPCVYALSDVVVSASSDQPEAFGRIIPEAQATGVLVVGTAHGGACETIDDGVTGIGRYAFTGCDLRRLTVAGSVTEAEEAAFENCWAETVNYGGRVRAWYSLSRDQYWFGHLYCVDSV